ncbi:MFS transporter [Caulobacter sp. 602-1]|uniref:MFS transporter n=1 Tax=Caulobacter sp. 602-1 TaxID=2492472 RepID=UPI000F633E21|nr:MFS transporter [Caulobacter sp. 602-1]RRN66043.1 MFS transporter [Caulobacter sp. 602-1]
MTTESAPTSVAPWPSPVRAWYVVAVLAFAYAFAILDRIAIGILVIPIQTDLGLTDTEMGVLQGAAFGVSYSLFAIPLGRFVDRHSRRTLLAAGICVWSLATIACAYARDFMGFFIARIFVGIGEASVSPAAASLIADYFPPERRGRAFSVFMLGSTLGIGLAYLLGAVALHLSGFVKGLGWTMLAGMKNWEIVFILVGVPGLLLAILALTTVREPVRREKGAVATGSSMSLKQALAKNRFAYLAVISGAALIMITVYAQLAWLPTHFIRRYGWSASEVSVAFGVGFLPIGVFSSLSAGWVLNWLRKRGRQDGPLLVIAFQGLVVMTCGALMCAAPTAPLAYLGFILVTVPGTWSYVAALAGLNEITPNELRGQVTGLFTLVTGLISLGGGAFAVGFLSDTLFPGPNGVGLGLMAVNTVATVIAVIIVLLTIKEYRDTVSRSTWLGQA